MKDIQEKTSEMKNSIGQRGRNSRLQILFAAALMFFLILAILLTSFQIAIYGDDQYSFYRKEYEKYAVTEELGMEMDDVMKVTEYMMDYLIGREEVLSIEIHVDGAYQDFFNEQDRLHMSDVRNLFLGGLLLRNILAAASAFCLIVLFIMKADVRKLLFRAYGISVGVFGVLLAFLGIAFAIDFTKCFTIFHEIFFTNDLWMFDPAADYMIRMLPEGFFSDFVVRIAGVFVGSLVILGAFAFFIRQGKERRIIASGKTDGKK